MATLTINHYINEANSFITDIRDNRNGYYLFAAKPQPWANSSGGNDDSAVLATNNSVAQVEQTIYEDVLYGKLLRDDDLSYVIPRNAWAANTVYATYDQNDPNLYNKNFYVVTDNYEVYKCIDNNSGAQSTVKPSLTVTSGTFRTGDGYTWKYMYSIDPASNTKFTTANYIPVTPNTQVQANATPGTIDVIKITNGGNNYVVYESGYIGGMVDQFTENVGFINQYRIQLPQTASNTDDYYVNSSIYLKSGFGAGQIREISSSNGMSKQIVVNEPFETFVRLDLANVQGTITTGYFVQQPFDDINYINTQGYFNVDATVTQTDTGTSGRILAANTSVLQVTKFIESARFSLGLPIVETTFSGSQKAGTVSVGNVGACNVAFVVAPGSGYTVNATVTITTNATGSGAIANAQANSSGKISNINITAAGNSYFTAPALTVSSPTAQTFNANTSVTGGIQAGSNNVIALGNSFNVTANTTGVSNTADVLFITGANTFMAVNDIVFYSVPTGNTAIPNLTGNTFYYVTFVNATAVALSATLGGTNVNIAETRTVAGQVHQIITGTALRYAANDLVTYTVSAGNTAVGGLTSGTTYFIDTANNTHVSLKSSPTGSRIQLTKGANQIGHSLRGQTATAVMFCDNQIVRGVGNSFNVTANTTGVSNTADVLLITNANTHMAVGDVVYYRVPAGNTAIPNLIANRSYFVTFANSTSIALSATAGGTNVNIAETRTGAGQVHQILTGTVLNDATANGYANGEYIRIGANTTSNIRRVTNTVNSTALIVSQPFAGLFTASANLHYKMPVVAEPSSVVPKGASGYISNTNLQSLQLSITNSAIVGRLFTVGEKVNMTDSSRVNQGANGVIAFANTTSVILSSIAGGWTPSSGGTQFFVSGQSSQQLSQISLVTSNPNITLIRPINSFKLGYPIFVKTTETGTPSGNAILIAKAVLPNDQTEYQIGPTVRIDGDGANLVAIAVVNTAPNSSYEITGVDIINPGSGYTQANVIIYAANNRGSGVTAVPIISPVHGHGSDAVSELGARYVGINAAFDNLSNENYKFLGYGEYRKIGILENPQFKDIRVTLTDFDRANFTLNAASVTPSAAWTPGEVVVQNTTGAAGVVVFGNSTFLQLKNVKGTFNASNTVYGYYSNTTANVNSLSINRFPVGNAAAVVTQSNSGAVGIIVQEGPNNSTYFMSNVVGQFADGDIMYDTVANAYATVESIFTANGTVDSSADFGNKFNQTARIALTAHSGTFQTGEYVRQEVSLASGRVVSYTQEKDLIVTSMSGSFAAGQTVTSNFTNANGICTFANSTYIRLTNVSQNLPLVAGHTINNGLGSTATISNVLPVLVLNDVSDATNFQAGTNNIIGQTSKASGTCNNQLLIRMPDLVRDSGTVIYVQSFAPVTRSATSKEEVKLVIKF